MTISPFCNAQKRRSLDLLFAILIHEKRGLIANGQGVLDLGDSQ